MRISDWSSDVCSSDLPCDAASIGCREACRGRLRRFCPPRHPCRGMLIETLPAAAPPAAVPGRPSSFAIEVPDALLGRARRSEEHTSELQSLMRISYAVFCLKQKKILE